jgi:hypothetical protein
MCRDRWSGRQSLPTPSSPRSQDPASRGRLHAGAKAVLLGSMALLGLVRLLGQGGPAILSVRPRGRTLRLPLEARKRAGAPRDTWRVVVRRMIGRLRSGCQTCDTAGDAAETAADVVRPDRRGGLVGRFARIPPGSMRESPCDAILAGAILCGPSAPETLREDASRPRGGAQAAVIRPRRMDVIRTFHRPQRHDRDTGPPLCYRPVNPERRSYRTNGRQAGLASCPG